MHWLFLIDRKWLFLFGSTWLIQPDANTADNKALNAESNTLNTILNIKHIIAKTDAQNITNATKSSPPIQLSQNSFSLKHFSFPHPSSG